LAIEQDAEKVHRRKKTGICLFWLSRLFGDLVHLVSFDQPKNPDRPDKPGPSQMCGLSLLGKLRRIKAPVAKG
jgi:hypothetical protein